MAHAAGQLCLLERCSRHHICLRALVISGCLCGHQEFLLGCVFILRHGDERGASAGKWAHAANELTARQDSNTLTNVENLVPLILECTAHASTSSSSLSACLQLLRALLLVFTFLLRPQVGSAVSAYPFTA